LHFRYEGNVNVIAKSDKEDLSSGNPPVHARGTCAIRGPRKCLSRFKRFGSALKLWGTREPSQ